MSVSNSQPVSSKKESVPIMENVFSDAKFKYPWRSYQKRVLNQLDVFLQDNHLHIVAPPGSGKTVLGLEVVRKLNQTTLILAPTLVIRDQWIERLCELFLEVDTVPDWISTDIRQPKKLTVVTYQGLHVACNEEEKKRNIIKNLKGAHLNVLVLDEAHHLKNQWWNTLKEVKEALSLTVVGLTATPPYDSSYSEWLRYLELNGPIDMEISIPELIREGDLCPHQDYVYFSNPTVEEIQLIQKYRNNIRTLFDEYSKSTFLIESFQKTAIWKEPQEHLEWIYTNFFIYTSYLILLSTNRIEIPCNHLDVVGISAKDEIPYLTYDRLEAILNFLLFQDRLFFMGNEEEKEKLLKQLKRHGVLDKRQVVLSYSRNLDKILLSSISKLKSIIEIVRFEESKLRKNLRMVILTDYIRMESLSQDVNVVSSVRKIGAIPIFEEILASEVKTTKIAVLTGSVVLLPKSSLPRLTQLWVERDMPIDSFLYKEYRDSHILLESNAIISKHMVLLTTQLFTEGEVELLIGTKALLGEGWDAPAINTLILASFVGSFVLSNQMRGRAIRTEKENPSKTSNIWHLICLDSTDDEGGRDMKLLSRRFQSFVGVSSKKIPYIENGINRLDVIRPQYTEDVVNELNESTFTIAAKRTNLNDRWMDAIHSGRELVDGVKVPFASETEKSYEEQKGLYLNKTIAYVVLDLVMALLIYGSEVLEVFLNNVRFIKNGNWIAYFLLYASIMGLIFFGVKTIKTFKLYLSYRDISKDIKQIAEALLESLIKQGSINTNRDSLEVEVSQDTQGAVSCYLKGGSIAEQSIFINALIEIVSVIDNPRYIIVRKSRFFKALRSDYHAVPTLLGVNKTLAGTFEKNWRKRVGRCQLVYTRTLEGRKFLLKARVKSLAAQFSEEELLNKYRKWS